MNPAFFSEDFKTDPWWWEWAPRPEPERTAPLPVEVDVLVVGSGFAGLNCARITAAAGRNTLLLDAGPAGFGASSRLAGYIGRFLHYSIQKLEAKVGQEKAHRMWKESGDAPVGPARSYRKGADGRRQALSRTFYRRLLARPLRGDGGERRIHQQECALRVLHVPGLGAA